MNHDPHNLIDAYIDATLDDAGFADLCDWLRADAEHRRVFARATADHSGIVDWSQGNTGSVLLPELEADTKDDWIKTLAALDDSSAQLHPVDRTDELVRRGQKAKEEARRARRDAERRHLGAAFGMRQTLVLPKPIVWLGAAAMIAIAAVLVMYFGPSQTRTTTPRSVTRPHETTPGSQSLTPVVAIVRNSVSAHWDSRGARGGSIHAGDEITLTEGLAEIVFENGATLIIQAPATFVADGDNALRLLEGQLAAGVPATASTFTVQTPTGNITNHNAEYGVIVNAEGQTLAEVFAGSITLNAAGSDSRISVSEGEAATANTNGQIHGVPSDASVFVRSEEFDLIQRAGNSSRDRWIATRHMLMRDPDVVTFVPFNRPGTDWPAGIGYRGLRLLDETSSTSHLPTRQSYGSAIAWNGGPGIGESLVANGTDPIFIDLDTEIDGAFETAGLLDDQGLIGRPGTTLYIAWQMQGDGDNAGADAFGGLSLMRGDRRMDDEPLFIGCAASATDWSAHPRRMGPGHLDGNDAIRSLMTSGSNLRADSRTHLWLVRIDFAAGPDRVRIYLDPDLDASRLPEANLQIDSYDVAFDRLRFVTGDGAMAWRIDDLLISTTRPTGSPGVLPGD